MSHQSKPSRLLIGGLLSILILVLIVKTFFIGYYQIPQNGMYPNLPAGSSLFANKCAYSSASSVKRGDVIIFVQEEDGTKYNYISRVIGLPGERVEAIDSSLKINGEPAQRERFARPTAKPSFGSRLAGCPMRSL